MSGWCSLVVILPGCRIMLFLTSYAARNGAVLVGLVGRRFTVYDQEPLYKVNVFSFVGIDIQQQQNLLCFTFKNAW